MPRPAHIDQDLLRSERRRLLRLLGVGAVGAVGAALAAAGSPALAQMQQGPTASMGGAAALGPTPPPPGAATGRPSAHAIPWADGHCAFCDMTLATPPAAPQGPGFRERTYAQWAFAAEARHFESIGCALGWAYAHGVVDGEGAALHVAGYDAPAALGPAGLLPGATASYLWAERLPASMMARLGAFPDPTAGEAFAAARAGDLGRWRLLDLSLLADLAPVPIANLVPLLQRQLG